jgi:peptide/nickel transport system substrate-binding protein
MMCEQRTYPTIRLILALVSGLAVAAPGVDAASGQTPKPGGVLTLTNYEDTPVGFAIHEASAPSAVFPALPCFNNLVVFDPHKKTQSVDTIIGDLAVKWSWQDNYRSLVFLLRNNVLWHDGRPFTSKDVKYTFDMVREAPEAQAKLRVNVRKGWYVNIDGIEAPELHTVVFRLKRPQPSLLMMLASGYSPVYPAHVAPAEFRNRCVGTGPFQLKEWQRGEFIEYVRNPNYFIPGRPYLDGVRWLAVAERSTRAAALQAGRADVAFPGDLPPAVVESMKKALPNLVVAEFPTLVSDNLLINTKVAPFDNPKVRQALSLAIDRRAAVKAVRQGWAVVGSVMLPKPHGIWGLPEADLAKLPGYGGAAAEKARARKLLTAAGYGSGHPLRFELSTRAIAIYLDFASFVVNELKQVGVEASLKQVDSAVWFPALTRGDYHVAANLTALSIDDPDATLYDNFGCSSPRNYSQYCNEELVRLIDQQSQELDAKKRLELVQQIQRRLEEEAVRPTVAWRTGFHVHWPRVHDLVAQPGMINWGRLQDVWLDR